MPTHHPEFERAAEVIWGAPAIAAAINRPVAATYYLLEKGQLPGARKIGKRWCFSPATFYAAVAA